MTSHDKVVNGKLLYLAAKLVTRLIVMKNVVSIA